MARSRRHGTVYNKMPAQPEPLVNGWTIDQKGRTEELCWRCWKYEDVLSTRSMSFATRAEAEEYARAHD